MIAMVRSLHDYAVRAKALSPFVEYRGDYYLLDVGKRTVTFFEDESVELTRPAALSRGADADFKPNLGWDTAKYVLRTRKRGKALGEDFWKKVQKDARAADLLLVEEALLREEAAILKRCFDAGSEDLIYRGVSIPVGARVVLAYNGKSLAALPALRRVWAASLKSAIAEAGGDDLDVITGEKCAAVPTHGKVSGVPGCDGAPLVSFKFGSYGHGGRCGLDGTGGENFPVSERTCRTYVAGFQHAIDRYMAAVAEDVGVLFWPIEGEDNPALELFADALRGWLTTEAAEALWKKIEDTRIDESHVAAALLRGSKGRIAVLNYGETTVENVRLSLLAFKSEFEDAQRNLTFRAASSFSLYGGETRGAFDSSTLAAIAWSVVMGTPYPQTIASNLPIEAIAAMPGNLAAAKLACAWRNAYMRRLS